MSDEPPRPPSTPLEDYALLSDLHTGPLVSREGSIDWLCFPRFDSPSVFAALLGGPEDGRWKLSAVGGEVASRRYLPRTFVLETTWRTPTGTAVVTDFLPPGGPEGHPDHADLVRRVECTAGTVEVEHDLRIRFDYNRALPWTRRVEVDADGTCGLLSIAGPDALLLTGPMLHAHGAAPAEPPRGAAPEEPGRPDDDAGGVSDRLTGRFALSAGESLDWALTWHESHHPLPRPVDPARALDQAVRFWTEWSSHVSTHKRHEQAVLRSLLVLRALTHRGTGGIVAAPTTSLPEEFGGVRNWDYRYTWLRDAALTIEVLVAHDFTDGALHWRNWLLRAVAGDPDQVQIMYGLAGERRLAETELSHLAGYEDSAPVRIGNGAVGQYQADVVGEVMLALAALRDAGIEEDTSSWELQKNLLRFCEHHYDRPGHGIWEMRGDPAFFVHGRAMMWAAFDQGIRAVEEHGLGGPVQRWRELRERLCTEIMERGFDEQLNTFTQTYGSTEVDASLLQLPHTGFVAYDDPRMLGTVARIEADLRGQHGLVHRYRTASGLDGLEGGEYPFLICTFWLVEQYARSGRVDDAGALLEQLAGYANDLGLYAEEFDPGTGRLAGNFPQAFSHLGFIRAVDAVVRARAGEDLEERSVS
ncbi:glycoside hydrolase family 15 protein [Kocuria turfanensis]|uniref:Glycoside hydrolase family 15 n=1 Tax=Kocuria turfanensis TaxID=388357 RepID=A0A512ID93_9MICC|nr:glycoside hydrolase family 15 protein [Kocuria turfanensis]GEO95668.1 glycoside hydrolase family 15 [Kocuria turfanensis]